MYKGSTSSKVRVVSSTRSLLLWWRTTIEHEAGGEYLYCFVRTLFFRSVAQVHWMPASPGGICIELDMFLDLLLESETKTVALATSLAWCGGYIGAIFRDSIGSLMQH